MIVKLDGFVKSRKMTIPVIPTKANQRRSLANQRRSLAGIQEKQAVLDLGWSLSRIKCGAGVTALMIFSNASTFIECFGTFYSGLLFAEEASGRARKIST
jgi:hypothetical protein